MKIRRIFGIYVQEQEISIENPYNIEAYKAYLKGDDVMELRQTIKDVSASFKIADFTSELQVRKSRFYDERALYYPFNRFCQNYNRRDNVKIGIDGKPNRYSSLRPVYSLNILGYNHFADDDTLRIFEMYDPKRSKKYGKELLQVGFFELNKNNIETEAQGHWRDYFLTGEVKPEAPDYIKKASRIIELANLSEEEKAMTTLLERAQADYDASISDAYHDGRDEGIVIGRDEGIAIGRDGGIAIGIDNRARDTAQIMLDDNEPLEKIIRYTGLTMDDIKKLQK